MKKFLRSPKFSAILMSAVIVNSGVVGYSVLDEQNNPESGYQNSYDITSVKNQAIAYGEIVEPILCECPGEEDTYQQYLRKNLVAITDIRENEYDVFYYGSTITIPSENISIFSSDYTPEFSEDEAWVGFEKESSYECDECDF